MKRIGILLLAILLITLFSATLVKAQEQGTIGPFRLYRHYAWARREVRVDELPWPDWLKKSLVSEEFDTSYEVESDGYYMAELSTYRGQTPPRKYLWKGFTVEYKIPEGAERGDKLRFQYYFVSYPKEVRLTVERNGVIVHDEKFVIENDGAPNPLTGKGVKVVEIKAVGGDGGAKEGVQFNTLVTSSVPSGLKYESNTAGRYRATFWHSTSVGGESYIKVRALSADKNGEVYLSAWDLTYGKIVYTVGEEELPPSGKSVTVKARADGIGAIKIRFKYRASSGGRVYVKKTPYTFKPGDPGTAVYGDKLHVELYFYNKVTINGVTYYLNYVSGASKSGSWYKAEVYSGNLVVTAHYKPGATLNVEARLGDSPIESEILVNGSTSKTTPFTLSSPGDLTVNLEASEYVLFPSGLAETVWTGSWQLIEQQGDWWYFETNSSGVATADLGEGWYVAQIKYDIKYKLVALKAGFRPIWSPSSSSGETFTSKFYLKPGETLKLYCVGIARGGATGSGGSQPPPSPPTPPEPPPGNTTGYAKVWIKIYKYVPAYFREWVIYENAQVLWSSDERLIWVTVPESKTYTSIAYYGTSNPPNQPEPRYGREVVSGRSFYLAGEIVGLPLHDPGYEGNYTIVVSQIYSNITLEPLVAYLLNPSTWEARYVPFDYLNISMPYNYSYIHEKCHRKAKIGYVEILNNVTIRYLPKVSYIGYRGVEYPEYRDWIFLDVVAWEPFKESYEDGFEDSTFTTYAVYNLTVLWHNWTAVEMHREGVLPENATLGIAWSYTIVVSSLNITVWGFYDRYGVYIVWESWYRYLPPKELNVPIEVPDEDVWFTLETSDEILFKQLLGRGSKYYGDTVNSTVMSDYYVEHEWFLDKWWVKHVNTVVRARWAYPMGGIGKPIYKAEEKVIPIVPLAMSVIGIKESPCFWMKLKWKPLNESNLPSYVDYCSCIRIDLYTTWDGRWWESVQTRDIARNDIYYIGPMPFHKRWPRIVELYVIDKHTKNLIFYILPTRI